ncbi:MAG: minor extracellular serine protease Vpr [Solirubrobacteraceae bacterium]|nr:minor extracellular serine protease Vpr [Solirubrobacteraceae bacterium]
MHHAPDRPRRVFRLAAALAVAVALLAAGGGQGADSRGVLDTGAAGWRGFVDGERSAIAVGERMIVVLRYPSLADRMAEAGGSATESAMRAWTAAALAGQKQIAARLSREGIQLVPDFVYTRTFNGFAAPIDGRALALLERDPDVVGVYPVRAAYPASLSRAELQAPQFDAGGGRRADLGLPGFDGSGVTIALLDTGIDVTHPFIHDRLLDGIDVLDPDGRALARPDPNEPMRVERHGTQIAGLLAGSGGPGGLRGVAPGASILPIRVAGWQPSAEGGYAVYSRTDQLLAGLERAVDPDADGDVLDAARIAVIGVTEPFAAFADGPVARAVAGAAHLDTLVVVPAGNEGPAGPGYGSIGGPGGSPAALTVGAADLRRETATVRIVVRAGLQVVLDRELPLAGAAAPRSPLLLTVMRPRRNVGSGPRGTPLARYFDDAGYSLVAGRAAFLARAAGPTDDAREAVLAGAAAILVDGVVPAGALGLDDRLDVPVVGLPSDAAAALRAAIARGLDVRVSLGAPGWRANGRRSAIAPFSSHGLAYGGGVKPELATAGVELVTADPGRNDDRTARYGTISGSSAAAALAGGAAAVLAQARPELDAVALKGALVGTAVQVRRSAVAAQGGGVLDLGGATAAEVVADPAAVGFGAADKAGWRAVRRVVVRNVSTRRVTIRVAASTEGIAGVSVTAKPARLPLRAGEQRVVTLTARVSFLPRGLGAIEGRARLEVSGGGRIYVPWAVALPIQGSALIGAVGLSARSFRASDRAPAVLTVQAGQVRDLAGRRQLRPVVRLDVELWRGAVRLGLLARLRDVLPGRYTFGLTGRGPRGATLPRGVYKLRVVALPPDGPPEAEVVGFRIR